MQNINFIESEMLSICFDSADNRLNISIFEPWNNSKIDIKCEGIIHSKITGLQNYNLIESLIVFSQSETDNFSSILHDAFLSEDISDHILLNDNNLKFLQIDSIVGAEVIILCEKITIKT